jgi:hypothetical protein
LPILNILVPHDGHTPWVAGLPFFMVMDLALLISFLARHFTQYACMIPPSLKLFDINNKTIAALVSSAAHVQILFFHAQISNFYI